MVMLLEGNANQLRNLREPIGEEQWSITFTNDSAPSLAPLNTSKFLNVKRSIHTNSSLSIDAPALRGVSAPGRKE